MADGDHPRLILHNFVSPHLCKILDRERLTLTLWFTRDKSHDEDSKLISFINRSPSNISPEFDTYPLPASDDMYWFSLDQASNHQSGFDSCCARIHILGYDLYSSKLENFSSAVDFSEVLIKPLQLSRGNELFKEFANVMHLLQVVHFYHRKVAELQTCEIKRKTNNIMSFSQTEVGKIGHLKLAFIKDLELAETVFGCLRRAKLTLLTVTFLLLQLLYGNRIHVS